MPKQTIESMFSEAYTKIHLTPNSAIKNEILGQVQMMKQQLLFGNLAPYSQTELNNFIKLTNDVISRLDSLMRGSDISIQLILQDLKNKFLSNIADVRIDYLNSHPESAIQLNRDFSVNIPSGFKGKVVQQTPTERRVYTEKTSKSYPHFGYANSEAPHSISVTPATESTDEEHKHLKSEL